jgi:hypothetical protein
MSQTFLFIYSYADPEELYMRARRVGHEVAGLWRKGVKC